MSKIASITKAQAVLFFFIVGTTASSVWVVAGQIKDGEIERLQTGHAVAVERIETQNQARIDQMDLLYSTQVMDAKANTNRCLEDLRTLRREIWSRTMDSAAEGLGLDGLFDNSE